jgi:hypothetical protein
MDTFAIPAERRGRSGWGFNVVWFDVVVRAAPFMYHDISYIMIHERSGPKP